MEANNKMKFRIIGVSEHSFKYANIEMDINPSNTEFEFAHLYKWNAQQKIFGIFFRISLNNKKENEKIELLQFEGSVHYSIENFSDIIQLDPEFSMDDNCETLLVSVAYSTIRGMLATRTMGTPLAAFILPIIDPSQLVKARKNGKNKS